jgi:hypothetical protein
MLEFFAQILRRLEDPESCVDRINVLRPGERGDRPRCPEAVVLDKHDVDVVVGAINLPAHQHEWQREVLGRQLPDAIVIPDLIAEIFTATLTCERGFGRRHPRAYCQFEYSLSKFGWELKKSHLLFCCYFVLLELWCWVVGSCVQNVVKEW